MAVLPVTETSTVSELVAVATLLPFVSATSEPSICRISAAPSATLVTVRVRPVNVCPLSTVEAVTAENRSAPGAASPSVNVGS
ncbi:MAG: hypothetical protein U5L06_07030 [Rhodovibrio sp.]|nr:hypothetical protein [Rhodovibrio sp.]